MSEQLNSHEAQKKHEKHDVKHEHVKKPEVDKDRLEKASKDLLETSRQATEQLAVPSKKLAIEKNDESAKFHAGTHSALKKDTYTQLLKEIRQKLPKRSRSFSRIIHQKNIESVSNVAAQTIARPAGLLGGGLAALLGSLVLLRYSHYYGFEYSYGFIFFAFGAGFIAGTVIEFLLKLLRKK